VADSPNKPRSLRTQLCINFLYITKRGAFEWYAFNLGSGGAMDGQRDPARSVAREARPGDSGSIRPWQAEDVLGEIAQDEVGRDRRHLVEPGLAELALDVVFLGEAEAAMGLHAGLRRRP
jgi:hypothetical protein